MKDGSQIVNRLAATTNVALMLELADQLMEREFGLPGIGVFSGPSGWGKSSAAAVCATNHRAAYVEIRSTYTTRYLFGVIARELGVDARGVTAAVGDRIAESLLQANRLLIIDEADHIVEKRMIEDLRGLYEASQCSMILIGEERLPQKLEKWERLASRVLSWVQAQPATRKDAEHLAALYCRGVEIEPALFDRMLKVSGESARRLSTNLHMIAQAARKSGLDRIGLDHFDAAKFTTGRPPAPRRIH